MALAHKRTQKKTKSAGLDFLFQLFHIHLQATEAREFLDEDSPWYGKESLDLPHALSDQINLGYFCLPEDTASFIMLTDDLVDDN